MCPWKISIGSFSALFAKIFWKETLQEALTYLLIFKVSKFGNVCKNAWELEEWLRNQVIYLIEYDFMIISQNHFQFKVNKIVRLNLIKI